MASGRISHVESLPSDLITNILKRLSIKTILGLGYVCRQWKNLFKTQYFTHQHYRFHSDHKNPLLLIHEDHCTHHSLSLLNHELETTESLAIPSDHFFREPWRIIGSCNGLLCVQGISSSIWLWNPMIREEREIPLTTPSRGFCRFGFGYSSKVNDYKIVRFYNQNLLKYEKHQCVFDTSYDRAEVFSLSSGLWKELEFESEVLAHGTISSEAESVDGTIFWWGKGHTSDILVSFNVATDVFTVTKTAMLTSLEPTDEHVIFFGHGVFENKFAVHLVSHDQFSGSYFITLGVMEEVVGDESGINLSLAKKYRLGPMSDMLFPACISKNEIACIDQGLGGDPNHNLHLFNLINNVTRKFEFSNDTSPLSGVCNYEKSLVSVWNNNPVE